MVILVATYGNRLATLPVVSADRVPSIYLNLPVGNTISLVFRGISIDVKLGVGVIEGECPELSVCSRRMVITVEVVECREYGRGYIRCSVV